jgi:hypothetical protein
MPPGWAMAAPTRASPAFVRRKPRSHRQQALHLLLGVAAMDIASFHASRRFADVKSERIAYFEQGQGPVALFIHGVPSPTATIGVTSSTASNTPRWGSFRSRHWSCGLQDIFFDKKWAYWLKDTIPGARRVIEVDDARLFFPEDRPDALAAPVLEFWSETS